jgi:hypothetical protein
MDAQMFRPERWDEEMPMHRDPTTAKWGYLPFSGGPRICLGSKCLLTPSQIIDRRANTDIVDFALTEAAYAVVRILQRFPKLTLPPKEKVELVGVEKKAMTLVVSITNGCRVKLRSS